MTSAIASIQKDHQRFGILLASLEEELAEIQAGLPANFELLHAMLDYVDGFLDRYHHPKEDEYLFRLLRQRDPAMEEKLNELREEHYRGRAIFQRLKQVAADYEALGTDEARGALAHLIRSYAEFERRHIAAEEREILPRAREVLTHTDWIEINAAFSENKDPLFSENRQRRFELLFNTIEMMAPPPFGRGLRSA